MGSRVKHVEKTRTAAKTLFMGPPYCRVEGIRLLILALGWQGYHCRVLHKKSYRRSVGAGFSRSRPNEVRLIPGSDLRSPRPAKAGAYDRSQTSPLVPFLCKAPLLRLCQTNRERNTRSTKTEHKRLSAAKPQPKGMATKGTKNTKGSYRSFCAVCAVCAVYALPKNFVKKQSFCLVLLLYDPL